MNGHHQLQEDDDQIILRPSIQSHVLGHSMISYNLSQYILNSRAWCLNIFYPIQPEEWKSQKQSCTNHYCMISHTAGWMRVGLHTHCAAAITSTSDTTLGRHVSCLLHIPLLKIIGDWLTRYLNAKHSSQNAQKNMFYANHRCNPHECITRLIFAHWLWTPGMLCTELWSFSAQKEVHRQVGCELALFLSYRQPFNPTCPGRACFVQWVAVVPMTPWLAWLEQVSSIHRACLWSCSSSFLCALQCKSSFFPLHEKTFYCDTEGGARFRAHVLQSPALLIIRGGKLFSTGQKYSQT